MKKILSILLALMLVFSFGCKDGMKFELPSAKPVGFAEATPKPVQSFEVKPKFSSDLSADEQFEQFDMGLFTGILKEDIRTLNNYLKEPADYGIDMNEVEITLGSYSRDANQEQLEWFKGQKELISYIDSNSLSEKNLLAYNTIERFIDRQIERCEKFYGYDEVLMPVSGEHASMPVYFWMYRIDSKKDAEDYLTLMEDMPRYFEDILEYEKYRAEINIFMTENALVDVIGDIDNILKTENNCFLLESYNEAVDALTDASATEKSELKSKNAKLLGECFFKAYKNLKEGLIGLQDKCREVKGVYYSSKKKDMDYYRFMISEMCGNVPLDDVYNVVLQNTNTYINMMKAAVSSKEADFSDDFNLGTVEENMAYLHKILDPIYPEIPEVDEVDIEYKKVPEGLKDVFSPAAYLRPAFDEWEKNIIILNKPEDDNTLLYTLAHEGINGHLYQNVYQHAIENEERLSLTQQLISNTAYAETWSTYAEGAFTFESDSKFADADKLMYFANKQFTVNYAAFISLCVNGYRNTLDEIIAMSNNIGVGEVAAKDFYGIACDMPFYYLEYAYGYGKMQELLAEASEKLGSNRITEKDFLEKVLSLGPADFDIIESELVKWEEELLSSGEVLKTHTVSKDGFAVQLPVGMEEISSSSMKAMFTARGAELKSGGIARDESTNMFSFFWNEYDEESTGDMTVLELLESVVNVSGMKYEVCNAEGIDYFDTSDNVEGLNSYEFVIKTDEGFWNISAIVDGKKHAVEDVLAWVKSVVLY